MPPIPNRTIDPYALKIPARQGGISPSAAFSRLSFTLNQYNCLAAVFIAFATFRVGLSVWQVSRETLRKGVALANPAAQAFDWKEITKMATWIRDHTPTETVVSTELDPLFYLFSQRKAIVPFRENHYDLVHEGGNPTSPSVRQRIFASISCETGSDALRFLP
jgi:hypothetical protein